MHKVNSVDSMSSLIEGSTVPSDRISVLDLLDTFSMTTQITKKLNSTVRKKGGEIKDMALRQRDRVTQYRDADIERLKHTVIKQVGKLEHTLTDESVITATEKLTFAIGVLNLFFLGFFMGSRPDWFHIIYTVQSSFLLPIRVYTYRRKEYHYFLADLCYFVNAMCLLFIWVFPNSKPLFIGCYALTYGTLSWAVITWRNSLVLHSLEKTTSTFIHILPPAVFHVITHQLDNEYKSTRFPGAVKVLKWHFFEGLVWASISYIIWQSLYHYFITVKRKEKIKAGRATSFEYLRKSYGKTRLGKFVNNLPEPYPVVAFTLIQFGYQVCTMCLCPLWYSNHLLSAMFLTIILFVASYNGATYYIDIFGKRFQRELIRLQSDVANWEQENNATVSPSLKPVKD